MGYDGPEGTWSNIMLFQYIKVERLWFYDGLWICPQWTSAPPPATAVFPHRTPWLSILMVKYGDIWWLISELRGYYQRNPDLVFVAEFWDAHLRPKFWSNNTTLARFRSTDSSTCSASGEKSDGSYICRSGRNSLAVWSYFVPLMYHILLRPRR